MTPEEIPQAPRDEALVSTDDHVKIVSCNMRIDPSLKKKEATYQVVLDFQLDNKKFKISAELFHEIFSISPRVPNEEFVAPPPHDALISARRRESMPYPRFTKVIIHYFLSKHKSISKRHGLYMNSIKDDVVLGRLKFVSKGEDNQVYGTLILDVMLNDEIKNSKAYQKYLDFSTGIVVLKKARKGIKTSVTLKKQASLSVDESDDEQEGRLTGRKQTSVVIRDTPNVSKKKTLDHSQKLKGIKLLSDDAQLALNTQKAIKASKHDIRTRQQSESSSEGASITPKVPDEPKGKSTVLSEGAGITPEGNQFLNNSLDISLIGTILENADAEINSLLDLQIQHEIPTVQPDPLLNVQVLVIPKHTTTTLIPTPLTTPLPTPPIISEAPTVTTTVPDPLPAVLQRLIESTVCEVLQKDPINREHHESQKEASEIRKLKLEHAIKEKMPKHSTTPFDQEEMDEYKQKDILFKIITPPNEA
ncbi:hypothetical protein Tco_0382275 [Tanacetum coccineum]